ncbi:D-2-hydroxyacid dehydrogenase [Saccharospirillum mangrovi]|uniref:D-2-hydroxyacid dehydrogenase n=1 Tax=Saccharospirillum mangrovi TaxID=2161747 RepID=UPI000D3335CF|nr:D-2-hydroxyacid dehydrogenase [Saccharospirillum mangrovi]
MKGAFLDRGTFPDELALQPPAAITDWTEYRLTQPEQRYERLAGCTLAVTNKVMLDADLLRQLPELKAIAVTATGTNNVDLDYCAEAGIAVFNATGYAEESVSEHALMLMLALMRNLKEYLADADQQGWSDSPFFLNRVAPIQNLAGRTLTVIGRGVLGEGLAQRAQALGMSICYAERPGAAQVRPGFTDFASALSQADVLSLHCPLTPETRHLINARTLAQVKPGCVLINTGRGGLIDESAVLDALRSGQLGGAGLDVATNEPPLPSDTIWRLAEHPRVILTPHVAWASNEAMSTLLRQIETKLTTWLEDR